MKKLIICSLLFIPILGKAQYMTADDFSNMITKEVLIAGCNQVGNLGYQIVLAKNRGKSKQYILESLQKTDDANPNVTTILETVHLNVVRLIYDRNIKSPAKGKWEADQYCRQAILAKVEGDE